ncbi:hypothetical protein [Vibrio sp. V04_P4A5T148]|uniref:hypothetical protein n=1 Tax=Vibrio sp. V04_P4A5T148 TaxID=1938659 RepID=UPI000B8EBE6F|nr:hypothetical protein [Vibrio sp. V04_P4A5T148]OXX31492.1 hypothetical protein B9J81_13870 [Vibrio sp. V04_P4A5T148]
MFGKLFGTYQEIQESNEKIKASEIDIFRLKLSMAYDNDLESIIAKVNEFRQLQQLMIEFDETFNKLKELDEEERLSLGLESITQDKKTKLLTLTKI